MQPQLSPWIVPFLLLLVGANPTLAADITVCSSGCDETSIQAALDIATPADEVVLLDDVFIVPGLFTRGDVLIRSASPSGKTTIQAATEPGVATARVFNVDVGHTLTLQDIRIAHGVESDGGGMLVLGSAILERCELFGNQATDDGGAIAFAGGAGDVLDLRDTEVFKNTASSVGGGIFVQSGQVILERSVVAMNRAFEGGGVRATGSSTTVAARNSTFSMNRANNGGAGIFNISGATTEIISCTFEGHSLRAIQSNGAGTTITVRNSILANSLTSNFNEGGSDCAVFSGGTITDLGYNLVENPGSVAWPQGTTITGVDPAIAVLAEFGGETRSIRLSSASVGYNTGDPTLAGTLDQRGNARPFSAGVDRGAFEFQGSEIVNPSQYWHRITGEGAMYCVNFKAYTHRGGNFEVYVHSASGYEMFNPNFFYARTYLGNPEGLPGAISAATWFGLSRRHLEHTLFETGKEWVRRTDGSLTIRDTPPTFNWAHIVPPAGGSGSTIFGAELGLDIDYPAFNTEYGQSVDEAVAMAEHSVMVANLMYLREMGIKHEIGRIIVRTDPGLDPYAAFTTRGTLLSGVRTWWETQMVLPASSHDVAHLFSGKSSVGGGLAYVSSIDTSFAYGMNIPTYSPDGNFFSFFRHEIGHNWRLGHFDGGTPEGSTINSGNSIARFSGPEQAIGLEYRDERVASLTDLGALSFPMPPQAATDHALFSSFTGGGFINLLANDSDANGNSLELVSVNGTSMGSMNGTLGLTATPGVVEYIQDTGSLPSSGIDVFQYRIRDSSGLEDIGYVFVKVIDYTSDSSYAQDFSGFPDGVPTFADGSFLSNVVEGSSATIVSEALQLVPETTDRESGYTLPTLFNTRGWKCTFDFRMKAAATQGAYGFTLNYGSPSPSRLDREGIADFPDGVQVEFRSWKFNPGIYVRTAGSSGTELAFTGDSGLANDQWRTATVWWIPGRGFTVDLDGARRLTDVATPDFTPTNSGTYVAFSGQSGFTDPNTMVTESNSVLIDNINFESFFITATDGNTPTVFALNGNYPNPFNPSTTISFDVARPGPVKLDVFDLRGRLVRRLTSPSVEFPAGRHSISWDGRSSDGALVASGVYVYRMEAGAFVATEKMTLLK